MPIKRGLTLVELLVVVAIVAILVALLLPAVQSARSAARRVHCANSFKEVALGTLNYASQHERLPALIVSEDPRWWGRVSWRYSVFPYVEEQAIYDAMAESNWTLEWTKASVSNSPIMVELFQCPETPGNPVVLPGWSMVFPGQVYDGVGAKNNRAVDKVLGVTVALREGAWYGKAHLYGTFARDDYGPEAKRHLLTGAKLQWISDGLSKTMLIVENSQVVNGHGVPDSDSSSELFFVTNEMSETLRLAINRRDGEYWSSFPDARMRSFHQGGINVSFCDGSVRFIRDDVGERELAVLAGRQDGENAR